MSSITWMPAASIKESIINDLGENRSQYYQLTGSLGRVCEYLSQPTLWQSKYTHSCEKEWERRLDYQTTCLERIKNLALGIILFLPTLLGWALCNMIQFFAGEAIDEKTYGEELDDWTKKKTFQTTGHAQAYAHFVDFCIRNRIRLESCPFQYIGGFRDVARAIPYLFQQPDSFFYGVDKIEGMEEGKNFLIIADNTYEAGDIKSSFRKNNNGKLPCGVAVLRSRVPGDEFSQKWIQPALDTITNRPNEE